MLRQEIPVSNLEDKNRELKMTATIPVVVKSKRDRHLKPQFTAAYFQYPGNASIQEFY